MKTFMANSQNVERKWWLIDASGMPLGRLSSQVAAILAGKHKSTYTPHVDTGDHCIIINCDKVVLTGNKLNQKIFRRHTGRPGSMVEIKYDKLMATRSDFAVMRAIKGMLPKNSLGAAMLKKLRVYKGSEHENQAQLPQVLKLV